MTFTTKLSSLIPAHYAFAWLFALMITQLLPNVGHTQTGNPIAGFQYLGLYGTSHYYKSTGSFTWAQADADAKLKGGQLASIQSQGEHDFLATPSPKNTGTWIGLNDVATEGTFVWSSGEPFTGYTNWFAGQPDNFSPGEDAVEIYLGQWNDQVATVVQPYILEFVVRDRKSVV